METAKVWRYYVGAIKVLVPEGTPVVQLGDTTFGFGGYLGVFDASEIPSLLRQGYLRRKP